ncbi:acetyl-CoA carboxylase biotin carboxyl carrier protein subunit [candidate division WOR-3 bacterium]|nr:acetyl-CoA carboxylase biotin carboxyl carrier protein subunit [candidate division WOR-3 bacterium]
MEKGKINVDFTEYETNIPESLKKLRRTYRLNKNKKIIKAFIPGNIKAVFVKEGDKVVLGQKLLVLEAMKMENEILAPVNGVVKKINVKLEDRVGKDQILIELK